MQDVEFLIYFTKNKQFVMASKWYTATFLGFVPRKSVFLNGTSPHQTTVSCQVPPTTHHTTTRTSLQLWRMFRVKYLSTLWSLVSASLLVKQFLLRNFSFHSVCAAAKRKYCVKSEKIFLQVHQIPTYFMLQRWKNSFREKMFVTSVSLCISLNNKRIY